MAMFMTIREGNCATSQLNAKECKLYTLNDINLEQQQNKKSLYSSGLRDVCIKDGNPSLLWSFWVH
jgi:hypothetical protein